MIHDKPNTSPLKWVKQELFFPVLLQLFFFFPLLFQVYISSPVDVRFALKKKPGHSHLQPAHTRPARSGGKRMSCIPACRRCSFKINPGKHQILLIRPEAAEDSTCLSLKASALLGHWSGIWLYFSMKIFSESSAFHRDLSVSTRPLLSCVYYKMMCWSQKHEEYSFFSHVFLTGVCLFSEHSAVSRTCPFTLFWKGFDWSADDGGGAERWEQLSHQQLSGSDLEKLNRIKCLRPLR